MNCGDILNKYNMLVNTILQIHKLNESECNIILNYINHNIRALHDNHYFCDNCISYLYYVASIQDTNLTRCPVCPRYCIIGIR